MTEDHGFHRPQSLAALPDSGLEVAIEAKPNERKNLAAFLDVQDIKALNARLLLQRWRGAGVRVTGSISAELTQTCVVTLEALPAKLAFEVDRKVLPEAMLDRDADPHEMLIDPEGDDPPDPLPHTLDLGTLAAEEVALNLDPYPRKAGAETPAADDDSPSGGSPFASLKSIMKT